MESIYEALQNLQLVAFILLGAVAVRHWRRHGGAASAWLAATFGVLAAVVVVGRLIPEPADSSSAQLAQHLLVAVLALFPYLLVRFSAAFSPLPRWFELLAAVLTAGAVLGIFAVGDIPPEREPRTGSFTVYIAVLLVQWVVLSGMVTWRLWLGGRQAPGVAKWRMRTLALGAAGLAVALVIAGTGGTTEEANGVQIATQVIVLLTVALFMVGFAPPAALRARWRRPAETALREVERSLARGIQTEDQIAALLLPHAASVLGGDAAELRDDAGRLIGRFSVRQSDAPDGSAEPSASGVRADGTAGSSLAVAMRAGTLSVTGSAYTPFFGEEEMALVERLATVADLAIERSELFGQLVDAQRIAQMGSWEWNPSSNEIVWSDGMYRIYGVDRSSFELTLESASSFQDHSTREQLEREIRATIEVGRPYEFEYSITTPAGAQVCLLARGAPILSADGTPTKVVGTVQDITERKSQERFREAFIANAAHELRTPLAALTGFVDVLSSAGSQLSEDKHAQVMAGMKRAGDRAITLVNNLLDLNRMQEGRLVLNRAPVECTRLVRRIIEANPPPRGQTVAVETEESVIVLADADRLDQVVTNLLTNAYRYGGDNVVVSARRTGDEVILAVSDDGEGVEDGLADALFQPFARGTRASSAGGSGLGLAIVKTLVEATGGEVAYEPVEPCGSRFTVRLPAA